MYKIEVELEGLAPFLYNKMSDVEIDLLDRGRTGWKRSLEQRIEEAHGKCHKDEEGNLIVPGENILKCIENAAMQTKVKDAKVLLASLLNATLFVDGHGRFASNEYTLFNKVGRIPPGPRGKAAVIRRPMIAQGWRLFFVLIMLDEARAPEMIREVLEHAGLFIGLGAWRPKYGRFRIIRWEVIGRAKVPATAPKALVGAKPKKK